MSSPRTARFKKDASVALAVLVALLCLWRLMTHPEQMGRLGPWLQGGVFGSNGVRVAQGGAQGTSPTGRTDAQASSSPNDASSDPPPAEGTNAARPAVQETNSPAPETNEPALAIPGFDRFAFEPSTNSPDAPALEGRLGQANAKSGDIQLSLLWNNYDDLDLHCKDPKNVHIFYSDKTPPLTYGELDVDRNAHPPYTPTPVENIYWPVGRAPAGLYRVYVVYYRRDSASGSTPFTVRTVVLGQTNYFHYSITYTGRRELNWICTIKYDPAAATPVERCRFLSQPR